MKKKKVSQSTVTTIWSCIAHALANRICIFDDDDANGMDDGHYELRTWKFARSFHWRITVLSMWESSLELCLRQNGELSFVVSYGGFLPKKYKGTFPTANSMMEYNAIVKRYLSILLRLLCEDFEYDFISALDSANPQTLLDDIEVYYNLNIKTEDMPAAINHKNKIKI